MPPLTSPPDCAGCFRLSQKIAELEGRISTLYQIQDSERLLDTLAAEASRLADNNTTLPWLGPSHISDPVKPLVKSSQEYDQDWPRLGAKPKVPNCSTPASAEPWTVIRGKRPGRIRSRTPPSASTPPSETVRLGNRFDVLAKLDKNPSYIPEPLAGPVQAPPRLLPSGPVGAAARRSEAAEHRAPLRPVRGRSSAPPGEPQRQPTTLVIGDSIIRNIRSGSAITCCFPGATVRDITTKATEVLAARPGITTVIIHAGTNDIRRQQSELLKHDFLHLITTLQRSVKDIHVSGPIPTCGRGCGRFSRLLALHTWLSSACSANGVNFIDNFNLFWSRRELFRGDGLHPNWLGAKLLSGNIFYSVLHPRAPPSGKQHTSPPSTPSDQSLYY